MNAEISEAKAALENLNADSAQKYAELSAIESRVQSLAEKENELKGRIERMNHDGGKFQAEYIADVRKANANMEALREKRAMLIKGNRELETLAKEIEKREQEQKTFSRAR